MPPSGSPSLFRLVLWVFAAATVPSAGAEPRPGELDFFEARIRPVLVEHCYKCHSASSEKLRGGLLVDSKDGLLKGGESGKPAILPGNPDKSLLIEAIRYGNEDLQMPPPKQGRLTDQQILDITAWVKSGAPDPRVTQAGNPGQPQSATASEHWAFQAPKKPTLPQVQYAEWAKTPIDLFILSKLEDRGLQPSPPADKRTLIRRATFDLIGLPPTAEEVDAFLRDKSPEAFARVMERLLASPRYGERWGRHWLDVARYADTKGYVYSDREEGRFVHSHAYRDWVIRALNEDMPYDRFLRLQLAADQLVETGDRRDLAAMGFLTLGRRFLGVQHDIIDDRIDTVTRGTLGLTVSCARCHDHKFDPIPTRDYYSLYGVFNGCTERTLALTTNQSSPEAAFERGLREREDKLKQTFQKKCDELADRLREQTPEYLVAVLTVDKLPSEEFYVIRGPKDLNPTIVRQWETYLSSAAKPADPVFALWHRLADLPKDDFGPAAAGIIQSLIAATGPPNRLNPLVLESFASNPPPSMEAAARRYGELLSQADAAWRDLVAAADEAEQTAPPALGNRAQEELRQILYAADAPVRVPKGAIVDLEWFFDEAGRVELAKLQAEIDRWIIKTPGSPVHAVILEDRATQRNPRVFVRGNPANKGDEVPRRFLEVLSGDKSRLFVQGSGRRELAEAIASPDNPLTARVMVNRVWLHHFGAGLVRTPSDFGIRCEPPSHPELLDWLAIQFINEGWSLKALHRLIMLSAVYQQRSDVEAAPRRGSSPVEVDKPGAAVPNLTRAGPVPIDPENQLLSRFNRRRLDFESMRDALLAVTGELDGAMGGPPVELFKSPASDRRAVYGLIDRQFLPGVLRVFDFSNPDMHTPQRLDTTVPQQALFFLNSPFVVERARSLARFVALKQMKSQDQGIQELYRSLFQHVPNAPQTRLGRAFLQEAQAAPPVELPKPVESPWQYGFGGFDATTGRIAGFQRLPHFTTGAWQGGAEWPDRKLGWVRLTADGGHAGNDLQHAAIRRWVAPVAGTVSIQGELKHEHAGGDGIVGRIVSSRSGELAVWTLHNGKAETKVEGVGVQRGDTVDFVVDYRANLNNDDFKWAPRIKLTPMENSATNAGDPQEWKADKDFAGPPEEPPRPLTPWEQYAQVLLLSNEFLFVD